MLKIFKDNYTFKNRILMKITNNIGIDSLKIALNITNEEFISFFKNSIREVHNEHWKLSREYLNDNSYIGNTLQIVSGYEILDSKLFDNCLIEFKNKYYEEYSLIYDRKFSIQPYNEIPSMGYIWIIMFPENLSDIDDLNDKLNTNILLETLKFNTKVKDIFSFSYLVCLNKLDAINCLNYLNDKYEILISLLE